MSFSVKDIEDMLKQHLEEQPYKAVCRECGSEIGAWCYKIDNALDIFIEVEPCECILEKNK